MKNLTDFCKAVETDVDPRLLAITILKKHPPPTPSRPSLFFHPLGIDYISYRIPVVGS